MKGQVGFSNLFDMIVVFIIYLALLPALNSMVSTTIAGIDPSNNLLIAVIKFIPVMLGIGIILTIGVLLYLKVRPQQQGYYP